MKPKQTRLIQNFGANTEHAEDVGRLLYGLSFVAIPFGGGMTEVPHIAAKQLLVNDGHSHVVNLCRVIQDDSMRAWLIAEADLRPFHPSALFESQCRSAKGPAMIPDRGAALDYFICVWMGRGGDALTTGELTGALPVRWNANGGGSNKRYRTAIEGLESWGRAFRRCEFTSLDALEFVATFCVRSDRTDSGIYCDPPWPDAGEEYAVGFTDEQQRDLALRLSLIQNARVVVRFGEHPLIRALYPSDTWTWHEFESRDQANQRKPEFLITRRCGR
jgi:site-specific DNA-adenine methylase